ncbi:glycosyltransferase [Castellaniella sp.]|uniref:CgeB family protein n=1 Tax=Castellaniella sp. TaxID=1955812 RepID=UPI002AFF1567|nr:glycosyltransferase [Castellaniella sp.]
MAIRTLSNWVYTHPDIAQDMAHAGPFGQLKIALVTDYFTADCLSAECRVRCMTPGNYRQVMDIWKPDLVFVESAFHGVGGAWRYRLAQQPKWLRLGPPSDIMRLVQHARQRNIPTVFWNKDDGAFFQDFIQVAKLFDYVFTTDGDCLAAYRAQLPPGVPVQVLSMPYQPKFHAFTGFAFTHNEACFTGSYYRKILNERGRFLGLMFQACHQAAMPLHVYDRNSGRLSHRFEFRFPQDSNLLLHPKVSHPETARLYKSHVVSINVNSVTASDTMCSRRLLEILACGGIAVTNPSRAVDRQFRDYCHVVDTADQARDLFARLRHGPATDDLARAEAGAQFVRQHHTWAHRLGQIADSVNL